jgi:hypothetical protein
VAKKGHLVFAENRKGVSFEKLFAPYLAGATRIVITDPYIRLFYQARNMMELLELIIRRKRPEDQISLHLGPVDKPDSQIACGVIQDCFLEGGSLGAWSDERRGMGSLRSLRD